MRILAVVLTMLAVAGPARAADLRFQVGQEGIAVAPSSLSCVRWTYDRLREVIVQIGLDKAAAARLAALTGKSIGRQIVIVAGGKPVFSATVRERIADGRIQIAGSLSISDAEALVRNIGGKRGDCGAFPAPPPDPDKKTQ